MKRIFTIVMSLSLLTAVPSLAQDLTPPKDGAVIRLASNKIQVSQKKEAVVDVWLVKSKRYAKRGFGGLEAKGPSGVSVSFEPKDDKAEVFSMKIKAGKEASPGKFSMMIKGKGENAQKVKSTVVSVIVGDDSMVDSDQE